MEIVKIYYLGLSMGAQLNNDDKTGEELPSKC